MRKFFCFFLFIFLIGSFHSAHAASVWKGMGLNESVDADQFLFDPGLGTLTSVELSILCDVNVEYISLDDPPYGGLSEPLDTEIGFDIWVYDSGRYVYGDFIWGVGTVESRAGEEWASGVTFNDAWDYFDDPDTLSAFTLQPGDSSVESWSYVFSVTPDFVVDNLEKEYNIGWVESFGQVDVIYEYTPIPIPSAVWLLGSGLVTLTGLRRKFRNS